MFGGVETLDVDPAQRMRSRDWVRFDDDARATVSKRELVRIRTGKTFAFTADANKLAFCRVHEQTVTLSERSDKAVFEWRR